jgi:hypothetical protein
VLRISNRPEPVNIVHCPSCNWHEPFFYSRRHHPTPKNTLRGNPGCAVGPKTPTPRCPSGSTGGVIVSPVGEDNPRLSSTVNLAVVLNTELDQALDELSRARAEIALLRAERAERRHLDDGSPAPVGT